MPSDSNSSSDDDNQNPNPNPNPPSIGFNFNVPTRFLTLGAGPEPEHKHESREEMVNGSLNDIDELPGKLSRVEVEEEKVEASSSRVWTNVLEIEEGEAPSSPSSGGYAGERGSSATSGIDDVNEDQIVEAQNNGDLDGVTDAQGPWTPGKRDGDEVISLVGAQKASLHPDDMLLLSNFVASPESFRTSESFSPICLPRYNPTAFLYTYVHYLDASQDTVDTYLILLTTSSDALYHLKDCRIRIETELLKSNVLVEVQKSMLDGGMHIEDLSINSGYRSGTVSPHLCQLRLATDSTERLRDTLNGAGGPAGLWHFMYRSIYLDQYVSSEFSSPINRIRQQKMLYRAYQKLYASMHDRGIGPHKTQFRRDENYVLLCWVTRDFELYAAFDPLADKALAIKACNRVCQWVKDMENEIFLLGASPFSW